MAFPAFQECGSSSCLLSKALAHTWITPGLLNLCRTHLCPGNPFRQSPSVHTLFQSGYILVLAPFLRWSCTLTPCCHLAHSLQEGSLHLLVIQTGADQRPGNGNGLAIPLSVALRYGVDPKLFQGPLTQKPLPRIYV